MTVNEAKRKLTELQHKQRAYSHATSLIYYDGVTTARAALRQTAARPSRSSRASSTSS